MEYTREIGPQYSKTIIINEKHLQQKFMSIQQTI